jgi:endonuclease V-like protein UPF0215 family
MDKSEKQAEIIKLLELIAEISTEIIRLQHAAIDLNVNRAIIQEKVDKLREEVKNE